jgi:hypothetical protein
MFSHVKKYKVESIETKCWVAMYLCNKKCDYKTYCGQKEIDNCPRHHPIKNLLNLLNFKITGKMPEMNHINHKQTKQYI